MIVLFTDFGLNDPYVGQMHAVFAREAPGVPVIDLFHSVPAFNIRAGAYLLPAYARDFPPGTVFVCVVDPGVGGVRRPVMLQADQRWYVGPDNGLFEMVRRRATEHECRVIRWRPSRLSASFHGRDLFAPVAARLARGEIPDSEPVSHFPERRSTESLLARREIPDSAPADISWPEDLAEIIHIDHYGNGITGMRAVSLSTAAGRSRRRRGVKIRPGFFGGAAGHGVLVRERQRAGRNRRQRRQCRGAAGTPARRSPHVDTAMTIT